MKTYTVQYKILNQWVNEGEGLSLLTARNAVMGSIAAAKPDECCADINRYRLVSSDGDYHAAPEFRIMFAMLEFPSEFGLRAFPGDRFRISQRSSYISEGVVILYTERFNAASGMWQSSCKGTVDELLAHLLPLPRICTDVRCTLPGDHPGVCEERNELQELLDDARRAQTAFWDALRRLEIAIGFDVDQNADLELTSIDDLREENEKECA